MLHIFSDLEGIRIAIEMEKRGEAFYRRAARVSRSDEAIAMLNALAADEMNHRAEFERLYRNESGALSAIAYDEETNAYLSAIAAEFIFPEGLMALRGVGFEKPEAVLQNAIQSEKDSVLFYTELTVHATDAHARDVFSEIIRQERGHLYRLQQRLEAISE